jgi:hypothetical protein
MPQNDKALLLRLKEHDVQFVIIGGVSCVLHGTSLVTFDLDICCPPTVESWKRIEAAVKGLHPFHRLAANKLPLELTDEMASRLKNLYLRTDLGILDCLGEVAGVGDYQQVLEHSVLHTASYGAFRTLQIDALIASKEAVGRERDLAAVKQLKAIKERAYAKALNRKSEI